MSKAELDPKTLRWVVRRIRSSNRALQKQADKWRRRKSGLPQDWYRGVMFAQECFAQGLERLLPQPKRKAKTRKRS